MVLVLPHVKPRRPRLTRDPGPFLEPGIEAQVDPVAGQPAWLRLLAGAGYQRNRAMEVQETLQGVDVVLVDGGLREQHNVDAVHLLAGSDQHPVEEVEVEFLGRRELEESEWLLP